MPGREPGGYERELGGLTARVDALERARSEHDEDLREHDRKIITKAERAQIAEHEKRLVRLENWRSSEFGKAAAIAGLITLAGLLLNLWVALR